MKSYRFSYSNDAEKAILRIKTSGGDNPKNLQTVFDNIKANPTTAGIQKHGPLKDCLNVGFGRKPELRLGYRFNNCCPPHVIKICTEKNSSGGCLGNIDIIYLMTREEAENFYNKSKKHLTDKINSRLSKLK